MLLWMCYDVFVIYRWSLGVLLYELTVTNDDTNITNMTNIINITNIPNIPNITNDTNNHMVV